MTVVDTTGSAREGETFDRHFVRLTSAPILARVLQLSDQAWADYLELREQYRRASSADEKREILDTLVEVVLDEPVRPIPIEQVERQAKAGLPGAAAADRFEREARAFGANLRRLRRDRRMTQPELAGAANMTQPQISYLERGEHRPQEATVRKLAEALGVSAEELLPLE